MMREKATYDLSYNIDPSKLLANHKWYKYCIDQNDDSVASRYESVHEMIETAYTELWQAVDDE